MSAPAWMHAPGCRVGMIYGMTPNAGGDFEFAYMIRADWIDSHGTKMIYPFRFADAQRVGPTLGTLPMLTEAGDENGVRFWYAPSFYALLDAVEVEQP